MDLRKKIKKNWRSPGLEPTLPAPSRTIVTEGNCQTTRPAKELAPWQALQRSHDTIQSLAALSPCQSSTVARSPSQTVPMSPQGQYRHQNIYKKKKETLWVSGKYIKKNWRAAGLEPTTSASLSSDIFSGVGTDLVE